MTFRTKEHREEQSRRMKKYWERRKSMGMRGTIPNPEYCKMEYTACIFWRNLVALYAGKPIVHTITEEMWIEMIKETAGKAAASLTSAKESTPEAAQPGG